MMNKTLASLATTALLAASTVTTAAPASAVQHVGYKREPSTCVNDGTTIKIGGSVLQKEVGKHGVIRMEIQWQLYTTDPSRAGSRPRATFTRRTLNFPDDARNFQWTGRTGQAGGGGNYQQWTGLAATHQYWLVAKMKWIRKGALRNWSHKLPVAHCS
jgi:hypothetical protein